MEAVLKKMKIQTGVLTRISKEKTMYEDEIVTIENQIKDMKASNKDEYDIKKRTECLEESRMMIPDCEKRLKSAVEVMTSLLNENTDCNNEEIYQKAKAALEQVQAVSVSG